MIGADGFQLLSAIYKESAPSWLQEVPMVQVLRQVWVQQYYAPDAAVRWRENDDLPPCALQIHSPYDAEARFSTKREIMWAGYKVHLTETCDEELPHLITHVETTPATTYDGAVTNTIHAALEAKGLAPEEHIVDAGYLDAEVLASAERVQKIMLIGPVPQDTSWQARDGHCFDKTQFTIDWQAQQVTCPMGKTSRYWIPTYDRHGKEVIHVKFHPADCLACASRPLCTQAKSGGRMVVLHPDPFQHLALQKARTRQKAPDFKQKYAKRAGIEGTISQGVRGFDLRHSRYIGLAKTRLQHLFIAAALNVVRMGAWLLEKAQAQTRLSRFGRLARAARAQIPA